MRDVGCWMLLARVSFTPPEDAEDVFMLSVLSFLLLFCLPLTSRNFSSFLFSCARTLRGPSPRWMGCLANNLAVSFNALQFLTMGHLSRKRTKRTNIKRQIYRRAYLIPKILTMGREQVGSCRKIDFQNITIFLVRQGICGTF